MPRYASIIALALLCAFSFALTGCGGPTKQGLEARSAAAERVNMVSAQVSFDQARRSFETGDLDRALREVNNAIVRYEDVADYHVLKGRVLLEMHQLEQAYRSFAEAIELDPSADRAHYFSGIISQRWSRHQPAYEHYRSAAEADPENVQYILATAESLIAMRRYEEAQSLIESRLERHEHNAALRHLLGHIALLEGDPALAADIFAEARLLNPDDMTLLEELARTRFDAGQYARALDAIRDLYRQAEANRHRDDLRHLEARTLSRMERYVEARHIYIELSQRMPANADVWIELAAIALELGDERRLEQGSAQAIIVAPERHEGYLLRAVFKRERGSTDRAERLFQQAIERATAVPTGRAAAMDELSSAAGDVGSPRRAGYLAYLHYGQMLEEAGRFEEAREAYADAIRLRPESTEARALLAHLNQQQALSSVIE